MIQTFDITEDRVDSQLVGRKAVGLALIPSPWRPPTIVVGAQHFNEWKSGDAVQKQLILNEIAKIVSNISVELQSSVLLRSSATMETLRERGAFTSKAVDRHSSIETISKAVQEIYFSFLRLDVAGEIAIIVQPEVRDVPTFRGHLSNERRVSKTVNQWAIELDEDSSEASRFNSQRSSPPDSESPLLAQNQRDLISCLKSVGRWCTNLDRGPTHLEWIWSNGRLYLVQLDFENDSLDDGVDPKLLLRRTEIANDVADSQPLHLVTIPTEFTGWNKIDKTNSLAGIHLGSYPNLFYITAGELESVNHSKLVKAIDNISGGRAVCRTDTKSSAIDHLNLPRTHSVKSTEAIKFMKETTLRLAKLGAAERDIAFIVHRFIPAKAAAWAWADPDSSLVRVDSLWGLPDGLQFLPHDSFEFDTARQKMSAEHLRFKPAFIQEDASGTWVELKVKRELCRSRSISSSHVKSIATRTHELAQTLNRRIQIMWFIDIPPELNVGTTLPWFMMGGAELAHLKSKPIAPSRSRFRIRTRGDIQAIRVKSPGPCVLDVSPDVDMIRQGDGFLDELATLALELSASIELHGSVLGHAFYTLERKGLTVIASGQKRYARVRGKRVFEKLVRNEIPKSIKDHGEQVRVATIKKSDLFLALKGKLLEEVQELIVARGDAEKAAEIADVLEVLRSLANEAGLSWSDVEEIAEEKRKKRGSFSEGIVLRETAWADLQETGDARKLQLSAIDLARIKEDAEGIHLNFFALVAASKGENVFVLDGRTFQIKLESGGLVVKRMPTKEDDQGRLPGMP